MKIYIDESGSFANAVNSRGALSCIGALTIKDETSDSLFTDYLKLRDSWGITSEPKWGSLGESEVASLIDLLLDYDAFFHVVVTDTCITHSDDITAIKDRLVNGIRRNITTQHTTELRKQAEEVCISISNLSYPLLIQFLLLTSLLDRHIRDMTLWFASKAPRELATFNWVIDAKSKNVSPYEKTWKQTAASYLQTMSLDNPMPMVAGLDYSSFGRFMVDVPWPDHLPNANGKTRLEGVDIGKLVCDSVRFSDSADTTGLQLAHIVCNAYRRALVGNIDLMRIKKIGRLLMKSRKTAAEFVVIHRDENYRSLFTNDIAERIILLELEASIRLNLN